MNGKPEPTRTKSRKDEDLYPTATISDGCETRPRSPESEALDAAPSADEYREAADDMYVVVERTVEVGSRIDETVAAAMVVRHAFLLAAGAVENERLSLPEVVAMLRAAEMPDLNGKDWTEDSLKRAVRGASGLAREAVGDAYEAQLPR